MSAALVLKAGKDKAVRQRHHWIFSGAIHRMPDVDAGELLPVESREGERLGWAYCNRNCSIVGRMVSFGSDEPLAAIRNNIASAIACRAQLFDPQKTNAYRVIHGEGDTLPGLVVDRYADVLVVQVSTAGMEMLKPQILEMLRQGMPSCTTIYEKSRIPSRREEKLRDFEGHLWGKAVDEVAVLENGLKFLVSLKDSQKTGFFLDQREMRSWVGAWSKNKRVLNCFSYTGGFSVYALWGGATQVDSVDISAGAIVYARGNVELNGYTTQGNHFYAEDVFTFLRERPLPYEMVILDPPAFAKRKEDVISACRGYKDINRIAIQKMPAGSMLLTSSCSYHVDEKLFQTVLFQAAAEAGRTVRIIGRHRQAMDHPINIYHPEGDYLKSLLLYIV